MSVRLRAFLAIHVLMSTLNYPIAPLWRRFAALAYDSLLLLALTFAYVALATFISVQLGEAVAHDYQPMFDGPWLLLGWVALMLFFYIWFWHKSGQTLGMRTWQIQVVADTDSIRLAGWSQCIIRALTGVLSFAFVGAGYWYAWMNPRRHCWHDQISRTQVIVLPKPQKNKTTPTSPHPPA